MFGVGEIDGLDRMSEVGEMHDCIFPGGEHGWGKFGEIVFLSRHFGWVLWHRYKKN